MSVYGICEAAVYVEGIRLYKVFHPREGNACSEVSSQKFVVRDHGDENGIGRSGYAPRQVDAIAVVVFDRARRIHVHQVPDI